MYRTFQNRKERHPKERSHWVETTHCNHPLAFRFLTYSARETIVFVNKMMAAPQEFASATMNGNAMRY